MKKSEKRERAANKLGACGVAFDIKHGFAVRQKQTVKSAAEKFNERARSDYHKWVAAGCPEV
jgi:hypothetical protein